MVSFECFINSIESNSALLLDSPYLSSHPLRSIQLIFSAFKTLTNQQVTIELKNDLAITGTLKSVDQFLNFRLDQIKVEDPERWPHMVSRARRREAASAGEDGSPEEPGVELRE